MGIRKTTKLSWTLAVAHFKLRNEGSYLGILWYLLNPILLFGLLLFVFSDRLGNEIEYYPLYLLLGIIMFNFFRKATVEATTLIRENGIIKSINFPREALPGSMILRNLFSHFFEIFLFVLLMIFLDIPPIQIIWYPIILLFFSVFIFGMALILSSLSAHFVDLGNLWSFGSNLIWFGTPIFYSIGGQTKLFYANLFNPVYYFITIARDSIIYNEIPELWMVIGAVLYALISLVVGLVVFNRLKRRFAELI